MAKKKTKKKAAKKKANVLTDEQLQKVRKLVKSKDAANVKVAIQQLQSTEATSDEWLDVFSSGTISLMVNTWDPAVWNVVVAALAAYPLLQAQFQELATERFENLSVIDQLGFIRNLEISWMDAKTDAKKNANASLTWSTEPTGTFVNLTIRVPLPGDKGTKWFRRASPLY